MKNRNICNKKFNRLTAIKFIKRINRKDGKHKYFWLFKCDCGNKKIIRKDQVLWGTTKSCGCLNIENLRSIKNLKRLSILNKKHGKTRTRFYNIWHGIKQRCLYNKHISFKYYGGRGIKICKDWIKFEEFMKDMYKSYLGHVKKYGKKNTTIDRIDNHKGYHKENCRWVTLKEQASNKINKI